MSQQKKKRSPPQGPFICYALRHTASGKSYTGQTNDFKRRLKQHNGKLSGGAKYTHRKRGQWEPIFHVTGFQTLRSVLQFEIAMKKRKVPAAFGKKRYTRGPSGRVRQLEYLLSLGKLNNELHSPFATNGIGVVCFVSRDEYLKWSGLTYGEFIDKRKTQGVPFSFL